MSGWLRGTVKEVVGGDTVVVVAGAAKGGIPPEKRLTLASLVAPRLGRRDGSTRDEPFAWESREFLRKMAVGKPCVFRVDYALDAAGGREFGTVFINEKDNLALASVAAGWAKVRSGGGQQSPFVEDLLKAQTAAEAGNLGVHTKDPSSAVTRYASDADFDAADYLRTVGKGKPVTAIVETVSSGSMMRVTLLPDLSSAMVMVAGVQCPSMGRRPAAAAVVVDSTTTTTTTTAPVVGTAAAAVAAGGGSAAPGAATDGQPEPFAREARYFTEQRCCNREVTLILEGVSQFGVLIASVHFDSGVDLGSELIKAGVAKAAEWSLNMMTSGAFKLRELERTARQSRVGLWHAHLPQTGNSTKLSNAFTGIVAEVVSGDCLIVRDGGGGVVERRVMLSSIKAPRGPARERAGEPWAAEAKEFLRQRLIGKEVAVSMEYTRKIPSVPSTTNSTNTTNQEDRVMSFATVTVSEGKGADVKINNVAELLLVRGLAQVVKHRGDEERSAHFEDLVNAEEAGKKGRKGQWSSKESTVPRVNDVTTAGSATRAKQYLPFLQRAGRVQGVVEYVLGGSRLKIYVPREGVTLAFSPSGVRCPSRDEPFAGEALSFTRQHCLQRDVEIELNSVDKAGTFLGTLRIPVSNSSTGKSFNLGAALLEAGLARLHPSFEGSDRDLDAAQSKAQKLRVGLWEKEEPTSSSVTGGGTGSAAAAATTGTTTSLNAAGGGGGARESVDIVVTHVIDASTFYVQVASDARAAWIVEQLAAMSLEQTSTTTTTTTTTILKVGDTCLAKFSADNQWYRAQIEKVHAVDPTAPQYDVLFLDYGNRDRVKGAVVRPTPPELSAVPVQAFCASLAFIRAPGLDADYGVEAAQALSDAMGNGQKLKAVIEKRVRIDGSGGAVTTTTTTGKGWGGAASSANTNSVTSTKLLLTVFPSGEDGDDIDASVNCQLVAQGLARAIEGGRGKPAPPTTGEAGAVYAAVRAAQESARSGRHALWEFGDIDTSDDDEQDSFGPSLGGAAAKRR